MARPHSHLPDSRSVHSLCSASIARWNTSCANEVVPAATSPSLLPPVAADSTPLAGRVAGWGRFFGRGPHHISPLSEGDGISPVLGT